MTFTVLHNRDHKVSQSVAFLMHCKTVTTLLRIRVGGHFVISNHKESWISLCHSIGQPSEIFIPKGSNNGTWILKVANECLLSGQNSPLYFSHLLLCFPFVFYFFFFLHAFSMNQWWSSTWAWEFSLCAQTRGHVRSHLPSWSVGGCEGQNLGSRYQW